MAALAVILGGLWLWASLTYDDEQARVQANEGIEAVYPLMSVAKQAYADTGSLLKPGQLTDLPLLARKHVADVKVGADLTMTITYRGVRAIDGKQLKLVPFVTAGKQLSWRCELPDVDPRWWPDYCRQKPDP